MQANENKGQQSKWGSSVEQMKMAAEGAPEKHRGRPDTRPSPTLIVPIPARAPITRTYAALTRLETRRYPDRARNYKIQNLAQLIFKIQTI